MFPEIKTVCVYAASSSQVSETYKSEAYELGKLLAQNQTTVKYGGGTIGLMGALAKAVLEHKGHLTGVIPQFMMKLEWGNKEATELIITHDMAERKAILYKEADAVVALPGGTGTLEELAEIISLKKLGLFTKPIVILNTNGFYNSLIDFLEVMVTERFIRTEHKQLWVVVEHAHQVLPAIAEAPEFNDAHSFAAL